MDFAICPSPLRPYLVPCPDSEPLGRVIFSLYGRCLPLTTAAFRGMCDSAPYRGAVVHKVLHGRYFFAGRQGIRRRKGKVQPPPDLVKNTEVVDSKAFKLRHSKLGTLSLCLWENDDDEEIRMDPVVVAAMDWTKFKKKNLRHCRLLHRLHHRHRLHAISSPLSTVSIAAIASMRSPLLSSLHRLMRSHLLPPPSPPSPPSPSPVSSPPSIASITVASLLSSLHRLHHRHRLHRCEGPLLST